MVPVLITKKIHWVKNLFPEVQPGAPQISWTKDCRESHETV